MDVVPTCQRVHRAALSMRAQKLFQLSQKARLSSTRRAAVTPRSPLTPSTIPTLLEQPAHFIPRASVQLRSFSRSVPACTKAIMNPRKDEEGEEMKIEILPRAANVGYLRP